MRKKQTVIFLILFQLLMLTNLSLFAQTVGTKTGAFYLTGSKLATQSIDSLTKSLADNYVREVYVQCKGTDGTLIDSTLLANFISKAHLNGIKVDLWYMVGQDNAYLTAHPDAHVYHCPNPAGGYPVPYKNTATYVNFIYPGYKDYVLSNIQRLVTNFNLDGLHLDWMRYSHVVYSWDTLSLKRADSLGVNTTRLLNLIDSNYTSLITNQNFAYTLYKNGDTDVVKWTNMRKNIIDDYIVSIRNLVKSIKPAVTLSALFMPEGTYDLNIADTYYAQNYALESPNLDLIVPEAFYKDFGFSSSWPQSITQKAINLVSPNCKIYTGVQSNSSVTAASLGLEISSALAGGAQGVVTYTVEATTADQWNTVRPLYKALDSTDITNAQFLGMCNNLSPLFPSGTGNVPDSVYTDSSNTTMLSAADVYGMMTNWLRYYGDNSKMPLTIPILRNVAGPVNPSGVQTANQIQKADILAQAKISADYIDANKTMPNYSTVGSTNYNDPAMFSVFLRAINYYHLNGVMPNYGTVRITNGPNTWTYGDSVVIKIPIPVVTIGEARKQTINNNIPDNLGKTLQVYGIVTSPNLTDTTGASYYIQDSTGAIEVAYNGASSNIFSVGDSITVTGVIAQTYGLTKIVPLSIDSTNYYCIKHNATVPSVKLLTLSQYLQNAESYEGQIIEVDTLYKSNGKWAPDATLSFMNANHSDSVSVYLSPYTNVGMSKEHLYPVNITAIASQHTTDSASVAGGYELIPTDSLNIVHIVIVDSNMVTSAQMHKMVSNVCAFMSLNLAVPDSIYTDTTNTRLVSAADFYYMMVNYIHSYIQNDSIFPETVSIIRGIKGPAHPTGVQTGNQIMKADFLAQAQISAGYIDTNKTLPNCVTVDTVSYDMPSMLWTLARAINWYYNNGNIWPNYSTVRTCKGPQTWTYGDIIEAVNNKTNEIPINFTLQQNYPNPFNPTTMIEFALPKAGLVTLKVYDILGKEVATLINQQMNSGNYKINFNASRLSSGIYFYRLQSANNVSVKKMILLK